MNADFRTGFTTEAQRHGEGMKPSGTVRFVSVAQLVYALLLIALPAYLLAIGDGWGVIFVAGLLGGPGIVALIGWLGLRKGRLWGWFVTLLADLATLSILIYALVEDGWQTFDWKVMGMTVVTAAISVILFTARRSYRHGVVTQSP